MKIFGALELYLKYVVHIANSSIKLPVRLALLCLCRIALQQNRIASSRVSDFGIARRGVRYVNAACCTVRAPGVGPLCLSNRRQTRFDFRKHVCQLTKNA
jgi:hypothetical protein